MFKEADEDRANHDGLGEREEDADDQDGDGLELGPAGIDRRFVPLATWVAPLALLRLSRRLEEDQDSRWRHEARSSARVERHSRSHSHSCFHPQKLLVPIDPQLF